MSKHRTESWNVKPAASSASAVSRLWQGDNVTLSADGTMIDEILPRKKCFHSSADRQSGYSVHRHQHDPAGAQHPLCWISWLQPPSTRMCSRCWWSPKADLAAADMLRTAYAGSGIPLVQLNYETGEGLDEVKRYISGHLCAFCGNSGVGKSTLLNTLAPALNRETGQISQKLGRGRHDPRGRDFLRSAAADWRTPRLCQP